MGLDQPLLHDELNNDNQIKLINGSEDEDKTNAKLTPEPSKSAQTMRKIKFILTLLTIVFTSFQVYDINTHKL